MDTMEENAQYNTEKTNNRIETLKSVGLINTKEISDGYHTFDQLYHDRTLLFAFVVNTVHKLHYGEAYKSKLHDDGTMFDDMFIVGVNTPEGQYSYHCDMKYWNYFKCLEVVKAPKWDGHTYEDIERIFTILL